MKKSYKISLILAIVGIGLILFAFITVTPDKVNSCLEKATTEAVLECTNSAMATARLYTMFFFAGVGLLLVSAVIAILERLHKK